MVKIKKKVEIYPPLFDSPVPAGFPSPAADYIEKFLDLNELIVKHPSSTFFVKVTGKSMVDANIFPGDIIAVDRSLEAQNNSIILAILDGEFTVKRFYKDRKTIILYPENKNFEPITVLQDHDFEVWGVVTYIIHEAKRE